MPTPSQLRAMQEFYSREDFIVNEIMDLPSSGDEEEDEILNFDINNANRMKREGTNLRIPPKKDDNQFEPQNEEERRWMKMDAAEQDKYEQERDNRETCGVCTASSQPPPNKKGDKR